MGDHFRREMAQHGAVEDPKVLRAERDALREERDALQTELSQLQRQPSHELARKTAVGLLVVVAVLAAMVSTVGIWAERNLLDTERFEERVGPLAQSPAVQSVLAAKFTDDLMELVDPKAFFEDALPEKGRILAIPLTSAVEGFVHKEVLAFMESDLFHELWLRASKTAHHNAIDLIKDRNPNVSADAEKITINLIPLIDAALAQLGEKSPELLGKSVDLPTLTVEDIPDAARIKIQQALDRPVSKTFGQIEVYDSGNLRTVQSAVSRFEDLKVVSVIALLVSTPLALWLSRRRRRTLLHLLVGTTFGLILIRRSAFIARDYVTDLSTEPSNRAA